ncbi:BTB and MATH domain-containing protein 45-like [Porites lutea]|uniref:BTB and MATH domain-containing protein 45-like n=1 Tax=Porites lutea TaxID=51062 RepID=UPI003CC51A04
MAGVGGNYGESQDFTQPWKFSDVVLVVEDQKFHVHRAVLAVCSPVFEEMFTSEFQGNGEKEILISGKMAIEIMELLQIIYPSVEEKLTEENCHRLLRLADEYQMKAIVQRCENFIVKMMYKSKKDPLVELVFAQTYNLQKFKRVCINLATFLSLEELKNHNVYDQIHFENIKDIMEGMIGRIRSARADPWSQTCGTAAKAVTFPVAGVGGNQGVFQDFTRPWKFSDVVLVVEGQKLHVHRAVLAVCSPVFEEMFTSEFEGNGEKEIPIPGKMASEIMELLQIIYPSVEEKLTEENCHPLLRLADEYQIKAIVQKCENFIVKMMNLNGLRKEVLVELVFAQKYNLQKLKHESIKRAQWLTLEELKNDGVYNQIHEENVKEIMEGMILLLQNPPNVIPFFRPQYSAVKKR